MESIGEKLRLARERNNLTIDQVARETHVAKRFLKALEDEDFAAFPGETYAMGFLRNYAEYLGLNAEELIGIYRNIKIQEQPLPMNELLESKPRLPSAADHRLRRRRGARPRGRGLPHLPGNRPGCRPRGRGQRPAAARARISSSRTRCARSGSPRGTPSPCRTTGRTTGSWFSPSATPSR